ncbi:hypothetical protein [Arthrobacter sp. 92]|uniref:hypothetical protein n=1 Tax=Arthrobacter sp. 92 TaxID=3418175 RepID=UPI003D021B6B
MKDLPVPRLPHRRGGNRLAIMLARTAEQVRAATVPYKVGDVVLGDDPFNGRQVGTITVIRGPVLGLRTACEGHPDFVPGIVYYDYRQVRTPD